MITERPFLNIERLFELQEQVAFYNTNKFLDRYLFIKDCLELIINRYVDTDKIDKTNKKEESLLVHSFLNNALSSLIVSTKLLCYGVPGDSLACLRVCWEALVCIEYMVEFDAYKQIQERVFKEKKAPNYIWCAKQLKKKDKIDRLKHWGYFSETGSHLLIERLKLGHFHLDGKKLPRMGQSILSEVEAFNFSNQLILIAMYMVNVFYDFYSKNVRDALPEEFYKQVEDLKNRYQNFVSQGKFWKPENDI